MSITFNPGSIHPQGRLPDRLTQEQWDELLEWFRYHGVSPEGVPLDEPVEIDEQHLTIWWRSVPNVTEPLVEVVEVQLAAGEFPLSRRRLTIRSPLPEALADTLADISAGRAAHQAWVKAVLDA